MEEDIANNSFNKLKNLLKKIFRVDYEDLDFGIYKIMNYKSKAINNFIDNIQSNVERKEINNDDKILFYNEVYNRIYDFFSRYFDNGDLIPQLRFGGKTKYYIPYNGEEISLYWVNKNEYYIKTTEHFYKYIFNAYDPFDKTYEWKIYFKIREAELEKNYVKSKEEKYFILDDDPLFLDENKKELTIYFNYRKLCDEDLDNYNIKIDDKNIQDKLKSEITNKILNNIKNDDLKNILTSKINDKTILEKHLNIYIKKNNTDYFIHRNLKGFLTNELDFYLKEEVLDLDDIINSNEKIKIIKDISLKIIEFLSQIEDFEKKLWEKKKFIYNVNYVITLDKMANKNGLYLIKKIINDDGIENQIKEWKSLGIIDDNFNKNIIIVNNIDGYGLNNKYKFLPVDTKYFKNLEYDILSLFDDLDDELNGTLIHSENYQALNTILPKFKEKVQTIYIDPPFNKEQNADYLYNVKYKDSTWATMLENRINLAKDLLKDTGSIFVRCDYNGNWIVRPIMDEIFGDDNFRNEVSVRRFKKNVMEKNIKKLPEGLDTIYVYTENFEKFSYFDPFKSNEKRRGFWRHMNDSTGNGNPKIFFGKELIPPKGKHWKYSQEKIDQLIEKEKLILQCKHCEYKHDKNKGLWKGCPICGEDDPQPKYWVEEKDAEVLDSNWGDIYGYSTAWHFQTENSEILLKRVIESTSNKGDLVMDFFLGSGATIAVAHKLKREWIGVEMGEHFYTIILPRMKKVLAYDKSGISKEKDVNEKYNENNAGGFFKYFDLEQYEDSLNNIEFDKSKENNDSLNHIQDYFIKFMLNYETNKSRIFLNLKSLENPFNYNLKIINDGEEKTVNIDLIETFNYLYNINVNKILSLNNDRKYIFVLGKKENENILVVWRDLNDINYENDKNFIYDTIDKHFKNINIDALLTNGNNIINNYRIKNGGKSLAPIFHGLIFGDE